MKKTENLKISVIVPVYKAEAYVHQCLDSIINQTYKNLEIILVDDGSPDCCPAICDEYAQKDRRINVIHQENSGQSKARNIALNFATGEVFAFVDSDDWLEVTAFEKLVDFLVLEDLDIVFMTANIVKGGNKIKTAFEFYPNHYICESSEVLNKMVRDDIGGQPWLKIYRRRCFDGVRFPEGRIYEDLAISFRPFEKAKRIGFVRMPLYNYRLNEEGTSLKKNPEKAYQLYLAFLDHLVYAKEHSKENVSVVLAKTVTHGMGVIHLEFMGGGGHEVEKVNQFMIEDKREILKCKEISLLRRKLLLIYYYYKPLYKMVWKMVLKIRKLVMRYNER